MFDLFYKKNNNSELLKYLGKNGFLNTQNYNPLYSEFFSLEKKNFNLINLNNRWSIKKVDDRNSNNKFVIRCLDDNKFEQKFNSFFKFSPLLDPVKFMVGKYKDIDDDKKIALPKIDNNICHKKVLDCNNSAYVDSFFSYLTSMLLHTKSFCHGIDYFGSFLAVQEEFQLNIYDDLEYLYDSDFFHKNKNKYFKMDDIDEEILLDSQSRNYRKKIKLDKSLKNIKSDEFDESIFENVFILTPESLKNHDDALKEEYSMHDNNNATKTSSAKRTNSTCSSRSSNTNGSDIEDDFESDSEDNNLGSRSGSCTNSALSDYSSMKNDDIVNAIIYNFPIQIICLEKMENTLDSLLENDDEELSVKEWTSCLFQIIMMLITYQKIFNFTHNDLHTNNIMFNKTDRRFINYKYNNVYYRVPTYGRLYKIIDFGRSIYTFKGKTICSDSYHPKGDAATQYNFEPYFNENKPRLKPNKSFDLCRLACSLYDYFADDIEDKKIIKHPIAKLVVEWSKDDKERNILYKNNGEERYPDFKLYKMIVRTVHNHIPEKQLDKEIFTKFKSSRKKIKKGKILNIDMLESMVE